MVTSVLQLLCRTTKLCWYDDDAFRNIVDDAKRFLDKVSARYLTVRDASAQVQCMCRMKGFEVGLGLADSLIR